MNDELTEHCQHLKDLQLEILEKFATALEKIPEPILEKFPHFDVDAFGRLRTLRKHVQAKIKRTEKLITELNKKQSKNVPSDSEYPDDIEDYVPLTTRLENTTDSSSNSTSRTFVSERENRVKDDPLASTSSSNQTSLYFRQSMQLQSSRISQTQNEDGESIRENSNHTTTVTTSKFQQSTKNTPPDITSPMQPKRSTFQLKRPMKAAISTQVTKKIDAIMERNPLPKSSSLENKSSLMEQSSEVKSPPIESKHSPMSATTSAKEASPSDSSEPLIDITDVYDELEDDYDDEAYRLPAKITKPSATVTVDDPWGSLEENFRAEDSIPLSQQIEPPISQEFKSFSGFLGPSSSTKKSTSSDSPTSVKLKSDQNNFEIGNFTGNYKNDGVSGEFDGIDYPHSSEMLKVSIKLRYRHF